MMPVVLFQLLSKGGKTLKDNYVSPEIVLHLVFSPVSSLHGRTERLIN